MKIGSLCSGYGGLDMAAQDVYGGDLAWVADPDPGATAILAHHHPTVPNLGDITAVDWSTVPAVDVLTAGFPCQDISNAGKRAGIEGERSGIWTHVVEAVGVLRPRLALFENVGALVVRGFDRVLADLAAIGFDAEWRCVRASDVGAPHRREWIFIAAWPADPKGARLQGPGLLGWATCGGGTSADSASISEREPADQAHAFSGSWDARPQSRGGSLRAAPDATGDGRDEGRPEPARQQRGSDVAERGDAPADAQGQRHGHAGASGQRGVSAAAVAGDLEWGPYAAAIARWEHVTGRPAPAATEPGRTGQPRLIPAFVEFLMGLPNGHVTAVPGLTRNQQLHALGNGVVPQQGAHALRMLLADAGQAAA